MIYKSSSILMLLAFVFAIAFNPVANTIEKDDEHAALYGVVFEAWGETPVEGAEVHLNDHSATTDDQGAFSFNELEAGTYTLTVDHENYETHESEVTLEEGQEKSVEIELEPIEE